MLPVQGSLALSIPGISGVSVPAASEGAAVRFRWPQDVRISSYDLMVRSGDQVQLANTRIRITTDRGVQLATDGLGLVTNMPGLFGRGIVQNGRQFGGRSNAFQYLIRSGELWTFQVENANALVAVVPELWFYFARLQRAA